MVPPAPGQPSLGITDYKVTEKGTVIITKVDRFSSAARAGVQMGDEILMINGTKFPATGVDVFVRDLVVATGVGGTLKMTINRAGKATEIPVQLRARKSLSVSLDEVSEVLERKIAP